MNLNDYTVDWQGYDWEQLLRPWTHLLPASYQLRMMNCFGDLFVMFEDSTVHLLDCAADRMDHVAKDWAHLIQLIDENPQWLLPNIVDDCVAAGKRLDKGQVYSLTPPPILGGPYSAENAMPLDIQVHFDLLGQICEQVRELPDGATVNIKITD